MFYLNSTLNFGILPLLVFQLEVYNIVDRLLTGLTAQEKGTTARWYSNKTPLILNRLLSAFLWFPRKKTRFKNKCNLQELARPCWVGQLKLLWVWISLRSIYRIVSVMLWQLILWSGDRVETLFLFPLSVEQYSQVDDVCLNSINCWMGSRCGVVH